MTLKKHTLSKVSLEKDCELINNQSLIIARCALMKGEDVEKFALSHVGLFLFGGLCAETNFVNNSEGFYVHYYS
jgi:hypothetical protein